jgi:hypothetical protein
MTEEDIYEMISEAGMYVSNFDKHIGRVWCSDGYPIDEELFCFAALVAAHEREKVAQWMVERSYATGHGDTVEDLLTEINWQAAEREREGCAKWAELVAREIDNTNNTATYIASGIRARGEK